MKNVRPIAPKPKRSFTTEISLNSNSFSSLISTFSLHDTIRSKNSKVSLNLEHESTLEISDFSKELNEYQEIESANEELFRILYREDRYNNETDRINNVPRSNNPFLKNFEQCE